MKADSTAPQNKRQSDVADRTANSHRHLMSLITTLSAEGKPIAIGEGATELRELLIAHFQEEEETGGLFDELRQMRPEFHWRLTSLRSQHRELLGLVDWIAEKSKEEACDLPRLLKDRDELVRLLKAHEAVETRLMTDAFYIDLGCGD